MDALKRLVATEPAVLVGIFVSLCSLLGVTIGADDVNAITQVATVLLPLVGAWVVRQNVTPTAKVPEVD